MATQTLMYREDSGYRTWFTTLELDQSRTSVRILTHFYVCGEIVTWSEKCRKAPPHPSRYAADRWATRGEDNVAVQYYVPLDDLGWLPISNPAHIFSYDE